MDQYTIIGKIGEGSYATVWRAKSKRDGKMVAVKQLKGVFLSWDDCLALAEVKVLPSITHPNIIKLHEVVREKETAFLIFQLCDSNLYQTTQKMREEGKQLTEDQVRYIMSALNNALVYLHERDIAHRDIKPENVMMNGSEIKLTDFGQAKCMRAKPSTEYVATRWYRAPEIILGAKDYDTASDMWALGATMAELFLLHPIFPGTSEFDQIFKICAVVGTPTDWPEGVRLGITKGINFPTVVRTGVTCLIPRASHSSIELIEALLQWNPKSRITAAAARKHQFFNAGPSTPLRGYIPDISDSPVSDQLIWNEEHSPKLKLPEFPSPLGGRSVTLLDASSTHFPTSQKPGSLSPSRLSPTSTPDMFSSASKSDPPVSRLNPNGRSSMLGSLLGNLDGPTSRQAQLVEQSIIKTKHRPVFLEESPLSNKEDSPSSLSSGENIAELTGLVAHSLGHPISPTSNPVAGHGRRAAARKLESGMMTGGAMSNSLGGSFQQMSATPAVAEASPVFGRRSKNPLGTSI